MPTSSGSGRIFDQLHTRQQGSSFDYAGAGRHILRVFRADARGNPVELELVYKTTGPGKTCAGSTCNDFTKESDEAATPIIVQPGNLPAP